MIILQILTALFAVACAWLNKWPLWLMRRYGMPGKSSEAEFHAANAAVKVVFVIVVVFSSATKFSHWPKLLLLSLLLLLVQWLFFDPFLNLFTGKPWHYLGTTAKLDRLVKNGRVKAAVVLLFIIALNFFL